MCIPIHWFPFALFENPVCFSNILPCKRSTRFPGVRISFTPEKCCQRFSTGSYGIHALETGKALIVKAFSIVIFHPSYMDSTSKALALVSIVDMPLSKVTSMVVWLPTIPTSLQCFQKSGFCLIHSLLESIRDGCPIWLNDLNCNESEIIVRTIRMDRV